MDTVKVGSFLQALRKAKGLTQAELADLFEVSNKTVSKWECGESLPEIPLLKGLADYYGVTVDEILSGERSMRNMDSEMKSNQDFLVERRFLKLKLYYFLSFCVSFISMCLYIILTYLVKRQDLGSLLSVCVAVSAFIPMGVGLVLFGGKNDYFDQFARIRNFIFKCTASLALVTGVLVFSDLYSLFMVIHEGLSVKEYFLNFHGLVLPLSYACLSAVLIYFITLFIYKMVISGNPGLFFKNALGFMNRTNAHLIGMLGLYLFIYFALPVSNYNSHGDRALTYIYQSSLLDHVEFWMLFVVILLAYVFMIAFRKNEILRIVMLGFTFILDVVIFFLGCEPAMVFSGILYGLFTFVTFALFILHIIFTAKSHKAKKQLN